jgi:hypothetical protein
MEHTRLRAWTLGLAAFASLSATVAVAQPEPPRENHYRVYHTPPLTYTEPLLLRDQFSQYKANQFQLFHWGNPAEKIVDGISYPPVDPFIHQMWWRAADINPIPLPQEIVVIDQFGTNKWLVDRPEFLVNPALKNVPGGSPPPWNHYLCYNARGVELKRVVILIDQFGTWQTQLAIGFRFCNPVEKTHLLTGKIEPILDPKAHLACYTYARSPFVYPVVAVDEFGNWQFDIFQDDCLCVPALKEHVVKTEESTWGKIKAMYN